MSNLIKLLLALALIFGVLYLLQMRVGEQPEIRVEKPVDPDALR